MTTDNELVIGAEPAGDKAPDTATAMRVMYIARIYRRAKSIYASQPHPSREQAAMEAFAAYPHATTCSTSRATLIDGEWSDRGGFNIQFHRR